MILVKSLGTGLTAAGVGGEQYLEAREGVCRIMPPLTHQLAETAAL
jgi:hypothetical protein